MTWYPGLGKIGDHDNILTVNDCATKKQYDNPPSNTPVNIRNLQNNIASVCYKNDNGTLPNAIVDIMEPKMINTFKATGRFSGRHYHLK